MSTIKLYLNNRYFASQICFFQYYNCLFKMGYGIVIYMLFEIYNVLNYAKKVLTVIANNSTNINNTNDHFSAHITEHKKKSKTWLILYFKLPL